MTPKPFAPKGARARWEYAYDALKAAGVGEVVTWADFAKAMPDFDLAKDRGAIIKAREELLLNEKHTAVSVRGVGYRISHGAEHNTLARKKRLTASRHLRGAKRILTNFNHDEVTEAMARQMVGDAMLIEQQERMIRSMKRAQSVLGRRTDALEKDRAEDRAAIDAVMARIAEIEKKFGGA